jgi:hypothetical protein
VSSTFWPKFDRKKAFVAVHSVRWREMNGDGADGHVDNKDQGA